MLCITDLFVMTLFAYGRNDTPETSRVYKRYDTTNVHCATYVFFVLQQPSLMGPGGPDIDAARSHSDASHSVGILWTSDQPDAETST